ncbi:CubicO group peptidase, beta-lactamase class C family [Nonomuraea maritima]|uniref:CubicO group peptidase, beta-lactamase class C family n=1 Tax=Nonomuraea maritima TaxID=683260 RepID=A0A1G9RUN1_9ACTN|nr:serine hydrolase domain-containing protein [Nonomuraea maritima]SDM26946.1 CubicO group peptidase, beta-lactamase class C family [Nonomuraea maritima]
MDLRDRLREAMSKHDVPGASVAVWRDGELHEAADGVVNKGTGVRATTDSVFQVGSSTKVWTAALVMQLVEEGLVGLDDPVGDHLPDFAHGAVTVRQLLVHSAGFDGDLFEDTGRGDDCLDRYLAYLGGAGAVHAPGEIFSYCNAGYCVLGALVARLRGGTWEQAVREHLLRPLGATHAVLLGEESVYFRASVGHVGPDNAVYSSWIPPRSNAPAGATMSLALRELVAFARALAAGGAPLLSRESVAAMLTPQIDVPGGGGWSPGSWGLGVSLFDWGAYGHDGNTPGQSTFWRIVPGADLVIAMTGNGGSFSGLVDDVAVPVIEEATGLTVPRPSVPPAEPAAVDGTPYAGAYRGPQYGYEVAAVPDGLDVTLLPGPLMESMGATRTTRRYVHLGGESFIAAEPEDGHHDVVTFVLRDGRAAFLHNGRAVARVRA